MACTTGSISTSRPHMGQNKRSGSPADTIVCWRTVVIFIFSRFFIRFRACAVVL
jgi:hypothetical protein